MTRPLSAAILVAAFFGAAISSAQTPEAAKRAPPMADPARIEAAKADVPKHTCGPVPDWPGKRASDNQKRAFERSAKTFGECIRPYLDERHAAIKANEAVAKAIIEEYNGALNKARADQESKD